jgi:hypothetical protein
MQQILNDNKEKIFIKEIPAVIIYEDRVYDETDDALIADNIRAFRLMMNLIANIDLKYNTSDFINGVLAKRNITLPMDKSNITDVNIIVSHDFNTNNNISLYLQTNYNKDLPITSDAPLWNSSNSIECLTSQLCKIGVDIDIQNSYIKPLKTWGINNKDKIKQLFNLSMVYYLFLLSQNSSDITKVYSDLDTLIQELYNSRPK